MIQVVIKELDPESDFGEYTIFEKTLNTMTFKEYKEYINSLPKELDDYPIVWYSAEYETSGAYTKPEDTIIIEKDRVII
jgi:hypothetical protein